MDNACASSNAELPSRNSAERQAATSVAPRKRFRAFCFHHAGGTAATFQRWVRATTPIEFTPMMIRKFVPEQSAQGAFHAASDAMADAIAADVEQDGRPFSLFGHSMGAEFAFEVCARLEQKGINPRVLIVAGNNAPNRPETGAYHSSMGEHALLDELEREGGTPNDVLRDENFQQFLLPLILADYRLFEDYEYRGYSVATPVIAHAATEDAGSPPSEVARWRAVARGPFKMEVFNGDHFFVHKLGDAYLQSVVHEIVSAG